MAIANWTLRTVADGTMVRSAMQASPPLDSRLVIPPRVRRGGQRRLLLWVAAAGLLLVLVVLLVLRPFSAAPPAYRTALVERRTIVQVVEAAGYLDVEVRADVPAPAAGRLVEISAKAGDKVSQGQVLGRLDERATRIAERDAQAAVSAAAARVAEAQASLSVAADHLARTERLRERELASDSDLNEARAGERKADAALRAALAEQRSSAQALKLAALSHDLTTISAPMDGVVLKAPQTRGGAVAPDLGALFVIGGPPGKLVIRADVAESDIAQVDPGKPATFSVPAFPGRSFQARVSRTEPDATRSGLAVRYPILLAVDNAEGTLLPGMTTNLRIEVSRREGVLAVREAALRFRPPAAPEAPSRSVVFRLVDSRPEPVSVRASISDGAYTAIEPADPSLLSIGTPVVVGTFDASNPKAKGPGIRLGSP